MPLKTQFLFERFFNFFTSSKSCKFPRAERAGSCSGKSTGTPTAPARVTVSKSTNTPSYSYFSIDLTKYSITPNSEGKITIYITFNGIRGV